MYRQKACPEGLLEALLTSYDCTSHDTAATLKKTAKETISLLTAAHEGIEYKIVVRESFCATLLARLRYTLFRSRARRNWIGARALLVRGIPTPDALALVEYRSGLVLKRSLLFTRYAEGACELNEYVLSRYGGAMSPTTRRQKKRFIRTLAELIRDMHAKGIYHADMKSNNILVREDGDAWKLFIIDLDRVRFRKSLSFKERANNLAQINASVAACITPADRMLFFRHYAKGQLPAREAKKYFRQIMAIGRRKNTRPYGLEFKEP
jgi:tRNA A-37 threonylcarbamoyl transferase component Bud32